MECTLDIKLSTSDIISILALLVAGLSALYARWTWSEAEKANKISLLGHRKEIYDAFFELKMHMMQKAETANIAKFQNSIITPRMQKSTYQLTWQKTSTNTTTLAFGSRKAIDLMAEYHMKQA